MAVLLPFFLLVCFHEVALGMLSDYFPRKGPIMQIASFPAGFAPTFEGLSPQGTPLPFWVRHPLLAVSVNVLFIGLNALLYGSLYTYCFIRVMKALSPGEESKHEEEMR